MGGGAIVRDPHPKGASIECVEPSELRGMGGCCSQREGLPVGPQDINQWLALKEEQPMEPLLKIFDCHHHFFDFKRASR